MHRCFCKVSHTHENLPKHKEEDMLILIEQSILMTNDKLIHNNNIKNLLLFSQHCFLNHFTPQYPQLSRLSTQPRYIHISTSAFSVTCSSSTTKTPFKLAILYNKSIADAHTSFLLDEAILYVTWYEERSIRIRSLHYSIFVAAETVMMELMFLSNVYIYIYIYIHVEIVFRIKGSVNHRLH